MRTKQIAVTASNFIEMHVLVKREAFDIVLLLWRIIDGVGCWELSEGNTT